MKTDFERSYWRVNSRIAGVDEVGRGCLAGAVVAAAVVFEQGFEPKGILEKVNDSNNLPRTCAKNLPKLLKPLPSATRLPKCSPSEIDKLNIFNATMRAMNQCD
jgi:ribonuclease HII